MGMSFEDNASGNSSREELESIDVVRILAGFLIHLAQPFTLYLIMLMAEFLSEYSLGFIEQLDPHSVG